MVKSDDRGVIDRSFSEGARMVFTDDLGSRALVVRFAESDSVEVSDQFVRVAEFVDDFFFYTTNLDRNE